MFCRHCGKEIAEGAAVCLGCGRPVVEPNKPEDTGGAGWWWIGFLLPIAGFLMWVTCMDTQPNRAKKAGIGALIGTIASVVACILIYVIWFLVVFAFIDGMMYYY